MKTNFLHHKTASNSENTNVLLFDSHEEFEKEALPKIIQTGLFVQTTNDYSPGDNLEVNICFQEIPNGIPIKCRVAWVRRHNDWNTSQSVGIGIVIDKRDTKRWQYLLKYVDLSGDPGPIKTGHGSYMIQDGIAKENVIFQTQRNDEVEIDVADKIRRRDSDAAILNLIKIIQVKQQITARDMPTKDQGQDTIRFIREF
jgi:Tfp pilus assembly protein PilZ